MEIKGKKLSIVSFENFDTVSNSLEITNAGKPNNGNKLVKEENIGRHSNSTVEINSFSLPARKKSLFSSSKVKDEQMDNTSNNGIDVNGIANLSNGKKEIYNTISSFHLCENNKKCMSMDFNSLKNKMDLNSSITTNVEKHFSSIASYDESKNNQYIEDIPILHERVSFESILDITEKNITKIFQEKEIAEGKKLIISDITGDLLYGKKIIMNIYGIAEGLRNKKDSLAIFGINNINNNDNNDQLEKMQTQTQSYTQKQSKSIPNDIDLNLKSDKLIANSCFFINYDRMHEKYFIRNCDYGKRAKQNPYLYYRLNQRLLIKNNVSIKIGELFINVAYEKSTRTYFFTENDEFITIGRTKCTINFSQSNLLSKLHCSFKFIKQENCFVLYDGDDKYYLSTNGVWVLIDSKYELGDQTVFKFCNCTFKIEKVC